MSFSFKIRHLNKQLDREKTTILYLSLYIQDSINPLPEHNILITKFGYCFSIESFFPGISLQLLNKVFLNRLEMIHKEDESFFEHQILSNKHSVFLSPIR